MGSRLERVASVASLGDRRLPLVTDEPAGRRDAEDSDHTPVFTAPTW